MGKIEMIPQRQLYPISQRLLQALDDLANAFRKEGVQFYIFGSLAQTYPRSYRGADLDLAFKIEGGSPLAKDQVRRIQKHVENLPTVRPVDLVDFNRMGDKFRQTASSCMVSLPVNHE